jgi:23S rRNA (adenine2503-C2)-methyltransferase
MLQRSPNLKRCYSSVIKNFKAPSSPTTVQKKKNLIGLTLTDLQQELEGLTHTKKFTPLQIWQHVYKKGYTKFEEMPNLSKDLQNELNAKYEINYGEVKV